MSEEFNLVYYHRETGKEYKVKFVTVHDYVILDPETGARLPISSWALNKAYRADKNNRKRQRKRKLDFRKRPVDITQ